MPHLTWPLPPQGPLVKLFVTVSTGRAKELRKGGRPVPPGVTLPALIDTGATSTLVDEAALGPLGLEAKDVAFIHTPSSGDAAVACNPYDAYLAISDTTGFNIGDSPVLAVNFARHGIKALVGRDVLARCLLVYDGSNRTFTLAY